MKSINLLIGLGVTAVLAGCSNSGDSDEYAIENHEPVSNRASVYCVQQGGELQAFNENNSRLMHCVFSEDEKYEQWAYYNNNHEKNKKR